MEFQVRRESTRPVGAKGGYWPTLSYYRIRDGWHADNCNWHFAAPTEDELRRKVDEHFAEYNRPKPINSEHFEKVLATFATGVCQFCGQPHPATVQSKQTESEVHATHQN